MPSNSDGQFRQLSDSADLGISVSVDGEQLIGAPAGIAETSATGAGLQDADIQVKFDGFDVRPVLSVTTSEGGSAYRAGDAVGFVAASNYPAWIAHSEIRVRAGATHGSLSSREDVIIPVDRSGHAVWVMPTEGSDKFAYVLRVYDAQGHFDETHPQSLIRSATSTELPRDRPSEDGLDHAAIRNIPVHGGAVTVYGRDVPAGYAVTAIGEHVPVDAEGEFVVQRILPPGEHRVDVALGNASGKGLSFSRDVNIPADDWFYVGLADLTIGKRFGSDRVVAADPSEYDGVYSKGRAAFYLKGKIKGKYLLTASADTGEDDLDTLFKGLDSKNPRQLLRRLDPEKYYPIYGDDSTAVEDAPTSGKFYIRLERGDSHVMWGNFKAAVNGSEYLRNERALYGASAVYRSEDMTSFGERRTEAALYAAQPGTLPQRDVYRGTGGSAYFLKRQDISTGSETVSIEIRDSVTGLVKTRRQLSASEDYTIDYMQGVIILTKPLSSTAGADAVVRDGALGSDPVNLVVQYEYTPATSEVDGYSYGGRAQTWLEDKLRLGVTGLSEETGNGDLDADQQLVGADFRIRHSDTTFIEGEYARSEGPGFGRSTSTDGGLTIVGKGSAGRIGQVANAWRVRGELDLADLGAGMPKGRLGAHYDSKQAGFSTLDDQTSVDQRVIGGFGEFALTDRMQLRLGYDDYSDAAGKKKAEASGDVVVDLNKTLRTSFGLKHTELANPTGVAGDNGRRTDGGVRLAYAPREGRNYYVFGQATLAPSEGIERNDRAGVGTELRLTETVGVSGEVSEGTSGIGAMAALNFNPTDVAEYHVGYRLDPDRELDGTGAIGNDRGGIVVGAKRKYNDALSLTSENNYDMFGRRRSLTSAYGVSYAPDTEWTYQAALETGEIRDPDNSDFDRQAVSVGLSYKDEDRLSGRLRGALGFEDSEDGSRDRDSYLVSGALSWKTNQDWRLLASLDAVVSRSDQSSILDGDYVEGSLGYAYRPVDNDRLNLLFKYGFLFDLPGVDQVNSANQAAGPRQRSHVLSVDGTYEVNQYVDVGAKYGFRIGDVETTRGAGIYTDNSAHLGILRADLHVIHRWDVLVEGRILRSPSANTTDYGAVTAVYRHIGDNAKAGLGYNFGRFTDDLTDLSDNNQGVFVNLVGKY
ncbi:TonB-dependent receptor [Hoeflea ulvae]|uniref:TonB-dependent receptor n=1 Tax=Hoeflea ulvae TaxID=2983764 RepID=A0ABT3YLX9_9HYPH|nr:TonB-dependent receptor [Hoeflea ulvae]MCY0096908.1 TonB-dependent receptor [Hoeflea ulvae]